MGGRLPSILRNIQAETKLLPERYGHTMKATQRIQQAAVWGLATLLLFSVMLFSVACTRGDGEKPGDTSSAGTQVVTTPATSGGTHGTDHGSDRPLDPDDGTVTPDGDRPGDPPTGTEGGHESRNFRSHFMH